MSNRFLLEAKNIIKTFPPTVALNDVHFCLRPGEIHGLMGENGSGKSTMCSIVSGIYPYDSGELFLDGEPYCPKNMIDAAAKGVCMIVQEQGTFASTTVAENIFIGKEKQFYSGIRLDTKKMANAAQKILDELQMQHIDARMTCGRLSFEDRKLVEIARAMYSDPKVLIIDETTSALSKNGRDILYGLMEKMKSEGKSVIFISHDIDELMEKCDYLTVFRDGIYIDEVPKEKFNADLIKQLMVGREMVGAYYREDFKPSHEDEVVLSVEHITQGIVTDVSFEAYKGEILGIGGLNECGMHELGKLIFGLEPRTIGVTRYQGGAEFKNPTDAMKLGIGYISKDRDKEAILTAGSIRDNIAYVLLAVGFGATNCCHPVAVQETYGSKYAGGIFGICMLGYMIICTFISPKISSALVKATGGSYTASMIYAIIACIIAVVFYTTIPQPKRRTLAEVAAEEKAAQEKAAQA